MSDSSSAFSSPRQVSSPPDIQTSRQGSEHSVEGIQAGSLSTAPSQRKTYSARRTNDERLDLLFNFLRNEVQWTLKDLFQALCSSKNPKNRRRQRAFADAAYNTPEVLTFYLVPSNAANLKTRLAVLDALQWGSSELRREITDLGTTDIFGKYDESKEDMPELNSHNLINSITQEAPNMLNILQKIAEPYEASKERENEHWPRWAIILSILCFSQRRSHCANLPTKLGLHLYSKGVKVQEIDLLAKFGLSISYKSVNRTMKDLAAHDAQLIVERGASLCQVSAYDNFEQVEGVKAQRVDESSTFHSVTTAIQLEGVDIPEGGLRQDMFNSRAELGIRDVLFSPGNMDTDIEHQVGPN
jgi:hypothetical protein